MTANNVDQKIDFRGFAVSLEENGNAWYLRATFSEVRAICVLPSVKCVPFAGFARQ